MSDTAGKGKLIAIKVIGDLKDITKLHKERPNDQYFKLGKRSFGILVEGSEKRKRHDITRDESAYSQQLSEYRLLIDYNSFKGQKNQQTLDEILEKGEVLFGGEQSCMTMSTKSQWKPIDQHFVEEGTFLVGKGLFEGVRFGVSEARKLGASRKCTASKCNGRISIFEGKFFTIKTDSHSCKVKDVVLPERDGSGALEELSSSDQVLDERMREEEVKSEDSHVSQKESSESEDSSESDDIISTSTKPKPGEVQDDEDSSSESEEEIKRPEVHEEVKETPGMNEEEKETPGMDDEDSSSEIQHIRQKWKAHYVEIRQNMTLLDGKALVLKDTLKEVSRRVGIFERKAKRVFKTHDVEILRRANIFLDKYTESITHWVQNLVDASPDELKKGSVETPDFDEIRLSDIDSENEEDQMLVKLRDNPTSRLRVFPKNDVPAIKQTWIDLYQSSLLFFTLAKGNAKHLDHYVKMKLRIRRFANKITQMADWNESQWKNSKTDIEKYTRKVDIYNRYVYAEEGPMALSTGSPVEKDFPDEVVEAAIKQAQEALHKIIASMQEVPTDPVQPSTVPTDPVQPSTVPTLPAKVPTQPAKPPTQAAKPPTQAAKPPTQAAKPPTQPAKPPTQPAQPAKPPTQPAKPPTQPTQPAKAPTQPIQPGRITRTKPEHSLVANPVCTRPLPSLLGDLRSPSTSPQQAPGSASRMRSTSTQRVPPTLPAKRSSDKVVKEVPKPEAKRRKTEVDMLAMYYPMPDKKKKKE